MVKVSGEKSLDYMKEEKTDSRYVYDSHSGSCYKPNRHLSIDEIVVDFERQVRILNDLFNCGLQFDIDWLVRAHAVCPAWVEKFFADVPWQRIAPTYKKAIEIMLDMIKKNSKYQFKNRFDHQSSLSFQRKIRTVRAQKRLFERQKVHDVIIIPAQFGLRHRGRSARRACVCFSSREFGLNTSTVINMFLTHQERSRDDDWSLGTYCLGDECNYRGSDIIPCFWFRYNDVLMFDGKVSNGYEEYDGSPSGFVPHLK